jgi:hypothetical protein
MELAQSCNARRQVCAIIDPDEYGHLLMLEEPALEDEQSTHEPPPALEPCLPTRSRRRSRSNSLQAGLTPTLPQGTTASELQGFPAQLTGQSSIEQGSSTDARKKQKTGPDICRRCRFGGPGSHSKIACIKGDGGPRPVSGNGKFKTQPPGWAGPLGVLFPLPREIFTPKSAELVRDGFTAVYSQVQELVFADQHVRLQPEQQNFIRFIGGASAERSPDQAWFTMEPYITWAKQRNDSENQGRRNNIAAKRKQPLNSSRTASSSRNAEAGPSRRPKKGKKRTGYQASARSKKRLNETRTSDEEDEDVEMDEVEDEDESDASDSE